MEGKEDPKAWTTWLLKTGLGTFVIFFIMNITAVKDKKPRKYFRDFLKPSKIKMRSKEDSKNA